MARAGFYAVESGKISFRRDGNWYSDEERIDNPRIALLFSRSIRQNPDGSFYLQVAEERAPITVEDTAYVVKAVEGDAPSGFTVVLNDEEREPLDPATLEVGRDNVLYCRVKGGTQRARFLRTESRLRGRRARRLLDLSARPALSAPQRGLGRQGRLSPPRGPALNSGRHPSNSGQF